MVGTEFKISGWIRDSEQSPLENIIVEAYHFPIEIIQWTTIKYYYLGKSNATDHSGYFEIIFPSNAYGIIDTEKSKYPNIYLKITKDNRTLYTNEFKRVTESTNSFHIDIPKKEVVYSDEIAEKIDWEFLTSKLFKGSNISLANAVSRIPEFLKPIKDSKYTKKLEQEKVGYRGMIIEDPEPKKSHNWKDHKIPWYDDWLEDNQYLENFPNVSAEKMIYGVENIPARIRKNRPVPYKVVTEDVVENVDVCVIGSGAAGAILAKKIVEGIEGEGKDVVLLEKGGYYDPEDFNQREVSMMNLLWKNSGLQFTDDLKILIAQGECVGGSTTINDAVCFDTPLHIRNQWKNEFGINISSEKWQDAIDEVKSNLSVEKIKGREASTNKNAQILKLACELEKNKFHGDYNERNCENCATCGTCHLGCHYETKKDMLNTYIIDALHLDNSKKFKIYSNCDVRKINYNGGTATGVEGKFIQNGKEIFSIKVNAKVVILAAGSIASSSLLLSNKIAQDKAGKGLALHPSTLVIGKFPEEIKASEGIPMAYSCDHFSVNQYDNNGLANGGFMLESIFTPIYQFAQTLPYDNLDELMADFKNYAMAGVLIRDGSIGNITLSNEGQTKIHYELGDKEIEDLTNGMKTLIKLFFDKQAEKVIIGYKGKFQITRQEYEEYPEYDEKNEKNEKNVLNKVIDDIIKDHQEDKLELKMGSAHPQGGNKMGADEVTSVVDENCKVFGFRNLFVCDASVFPTAIGVNPQITVMALAEMTADNILKVWNRDFEGIELTEDLGKTCSIKQPMFCGSDALSCMFSQTEEKDIDLLDLVNSYKAANERWSFDLNSLKIKNNERWRGFLPELVDSPGEVRLDVEQEIVKYISGFWKRFLIKDGQIDGDMHLYVDPHGKFKVEAAKETFNSFGEVIVLTYPAINFIYDMIKFVDENTIVGKIFYQRPNDQNREVDPNKYPTNKILIPDGKEVACFCLTNNYPLEYMDEYDFDNIFDLHGTETTLNDNSGYWSLRIVEEHLLGPIQKVFRFEKDKPYEKESDSDQDESYEEAILEDQGDLNTEVIDGQDDPFEDLASSIDPNEESKQNALWEEINDKFSEMKKAIPEGMWDRSLRKVSENLLVGKLTSPPFDKSINEFPLYAEEFGNDQEKFVIRFVLTTVAESSI